MRIISVREQKELANIAVDYFNAKWSSDGNSDFYKECILNCLNSTHPLPQWYLLYNEDDIIGCASLIDNSLLTNMNLTPWFCSLYIEEKYRGHSYGRLLLDKARHDAGLVGYQFVYLATDIEGYYEHFDWELVGMVYENSRLYKAKTL
jgi:GNAT superfamily N-acetyltransferase